MSAISSHFIINSRREKCLSMYVFSINLSTVIYLVRVELSLFPTIFIRLTHL